MNSPVELSHLSSPRFEVDMSLSRPATGMHVKGESVCESSTFCLRDTKGGGDFLVLREIHSLGFSA